MRSIAAKPAAKTLAITFLFMGIVSVVLLLLLSWWRPASFPLPGLPRLLLQPVIFAVVGYISTRVFCSIYNRVAGRWGGIRVHLTEIHSPFEPRWKP